MELQLLVIDLGDGVVVKVEKGNIEPDSAFIYFRRVELNTAFLLDATFQDVRIAIDAIRVVEAPPVPRIEAVENQNMPGDYCYRVIGGTPQTKLLWATNYAALCKIAGYTLPVWEPPKKRGVWVNLTHEQTMYKHGEYVDIDLRLPVQVWRYTREG